MKPPPEEPGSALASDGVPACFCGSTSYAVLLWGNRDRLLRRDYAFSIARCTSCALARTLPVPDPIQYAAGYTLTTRNGEYVGGFDDDWSEPLIRSIEPYAGGRRLLDIGCHVGNLVEAAAQRGFEAEGIDLDPVATDAGRRRGRNLSARPIDEVRGPYDVVILNHVLEHVEALRPFLGHVERVLARGGRAFVFSPHYRGLLPRLMRDRWMGWFPSQHVWHFTPATLAGVVRETTRLRVVREATRGVIEPPSVGVKGRAKALVSAASRNVGLGDQIEAILEEPDESRRAR